MQKTKVPAHRRLVVGMLGGKGNGKDTAAQFLVTERGFRRIAFADKLYQEAADAFGVTVAFLGDRSPVTVPGLGTMELKEAPRPELALRNCKDPDFVTCVLEDTPAWALEKLGIPTLTVDSPLSPRLVMQLWGTEYRRLRGHDSYWIDVVARAVHESPSESFVITDVRFPNEHKFITELAEGVRVRVRNPEVERLVAGDEHPSETAARGLAVDHEVINEMGQLNALRLRMLAIADTALEPELA